LLFCCWQLVVYVVFAYVFIDSYDSHLCSLSLQFSLKLAERKVREIHFDFLRFNGNEQYSCHTLSIKIKQYCLMNWNYQSVDGCTFIREKSTVALKYYLLKLHSTFLFITRIQEHVIKFEFIFLNLLPIPIFSTQLYL